MSDALTREQLAERLDRLQRRAHHDDHLRAHLRRSGIAHDSTAAPAASGPSPLARGERTPLSIVDRRTIAVSVIDQRPPMVLFPMGLPPAYTPTRRASSAAEVSPGLREGGPSLRSADEHAEQAEGAASSAVETADALPPLGRWWFLEADVLVVTAALLCIAVLGVVAMAVVGGAR